MEKSYSYDINIIKVKEYLEFLEKKEIDLKPEYQRNYVWTKKQKAEYIKALFLNKAPSLITTSKIDNKIRIIDGKQRTLTIFSFINNNFPVEVKDNDFRFYSNINEEFVEEHQKKHKDANYSCLSKDNKNYFRNIKLVLQEYNGLTYLDETSIFTNLQNGTSLSAGERVIGYIKDKENALYYSKIVDSLEGDLRNFVKLERKEHHLVMMHLLYISDEEFKIKVSSSKRFLEILEESDELQDNVNECYDFLKYFLKIYNNDRISKYKKKKKIFYITMYCVRSYYKKLLEIDESIVVNFIKTFMEDVENEQFDLSEKYENITPEIINIFDDLFKKTVSKIKNKISKLTTEDIDSDSDFESEDDKTNNFVEEDSDSDLDSDDEEVQKLKN